jgi:hypothetical protein
LAMVIDISFENKKLKEMVCGKNSTIKGKFV